MWRGITKAEVIVAPVPSSTASHASRVNARRGPVAVRRGDHLGVQAIGEVVADDREDHHRRYGPADRYAGQTTRISLDLRATGHRDRDGYHPHEIGARFVGALERQSRSVTIAGRSRRASSFCASTGARRHYPRRAQIWMISAAAGMATRPGLANGPAAAVGRGIRR
jgi:hypothetical protein